MKLTDPITIIPFVGDKYATLFSILGINTIKDLLYYFPRNYSDSSIIHKFSNLRYDERRATIGELVKFNSIKTRKRITIQKAVFKSSEGTLNVTWFNQPFLKNSLEVGEHYLLFGKLNSKTSVPELLSPEVEKLSPDTKHIGRITPIYPLTAGIKNKWLRARIKWVLDKLNYIVDLKETLPGEFLEKYQLADLKDALKEVHFPDDKKTLKTARYRLSFDEMLDIQIKIEKKREEKKKLHAKPISTTEKTFENFTTKLKFKLTRDQSKVINHIYEKIDKDTPLDMLLQGDVGSGKTIVAIASSYATSDAGFKTAYLAPTTILSEQIYKEFNSYIDKEKVFLINSKTDVQKDFPRDAIIVGTHALFFQKEEIFENLNLLIIDEEHRFGVDQREHLQKIISEYSPHKLSMTATPIPRSLAMTIWGDTDISYIKSKPAGRKDVETMFVPGSKIESSYDWIKNVMKETKTQVFWVCPLIEESDILTANSAKETFKKVKKIFSNKKVELVHGKTKDKEKIIDHFKDGKFDILVTTPIIEVGIDIPNANLIVIESSERFGLAQLHQFRGRVGRSDAQAHCLLYSTEEELSHDQKNRLKYFCETNDGLELAKYDLKRRGPGEVYGTKQSGIPDLKIADIFDEKLLSQTKEAAKIMLKKYL